MVTTQTLACPHCDRPLQIPASAVGKRVRCPGCSVRASIVEEGGRIALVAQAMLEDEKEEQLAPAPRVTRHLSKHRRSSRAADVGLERPGLVLVAGIIQLLGSLQWLAGGAFLLLVGATLTGTGDDVGVEVGTLLTGCALMLLSLGLVLVWAGFGLLAGNSAARTTSLTISGFGLLFGVAAVLFTVRVLMSGPSGAFALVQALLSLAWPLFMIFCLVGPESARWFESQSRSGRMRRSRARREEEAQAQAE